MASAPNSGCRVGMGWIGIRFIGFRVQGLVCSVRLQGLG